MDASRKPVGTSWEVARIMVARWLSPDDSSFEASVFTRGAIRLLQAVVYELGLSYDDPRSLAACRSFLAAEETAPGSVTRRLQLSRDPEVVSIAQEVQARGEGWVVTETAQRNVIVMTAFMNLPQEYT